MSVTYILASLAASDISLAASCSLRDKEHASLLHMISDRNNEKPKNTVNPMNCLIA